MSRARPPSALCGPTHPTVPYPRSDVHSVPPRSLGHRRTGRNRAGSGTRRGHHKRIGSGTHPHLQAPAGHFNRAISKSRDPHPTYYPVDTHPGIHPLVWADNQGHRLVCSGRSQGCSHSAALRKSQSRILGTRPHLQENEGRTEGGESRA